MTALPVIPQIPVCITGMSATQRGASREQRDTALGESGHSMAVAKKR